MIQHIRTADTAVLTLLVERVHIREVLLVAHGGGAARRLFDQVEAALGEAVVARRRTVGMERLDLRSGAVVRIANFNDRARGTSPDLVIVDHFAFTAGLVEVGPLVALGADLVALQ